MTCTNNSYFIVIKNVSYQKAKLLFSSLDYRHETGFWGIGMNNELFLAYSMNRKYLTKKEKTLRWKVQNNYMAR